MEESTHRTQLTAPSPVTWKSPHWHFMFVCLKQSLLQLPVDTCEYLEHHALPFCVIQRAWRQAGRHSLTKLDVFSIWAWPLGKDRNLGCLVCLFIYSFPSPFLQSHAQAIWQGLCSPSGELWVPAGPSHAFSFLPFESVIKTTWLSHKCACSKSWGAIMYRRRVDTFMIWS